jgi:hypothetical protein
MPVRRFVEFAYQRFAPEQGSGPDRVFGREVSPREDDSMRSYE